VVVRRPLQAGGAVEEVIMSQHRSSTFSAQRSRLPARLLRLACLAMPLAFGACAAGGDPAKLAAEAPSFFDDAGFAPSTEPLNAADVFKVTPAMLDFIDKQIMPVSRSKGLQAGLTDALYNRSQLQLEYEASKTRNAAEAFEARQGNCLSLVIMTGAFAKAMGLTVTFQQVTTDEMWSRGGDMYFMSGHVNLMLERPFADTVARVDRYRAYTIDFLAPADTMGLHVRPIHENTVLAMYMNNRAAEALVAGQVDNAYWRAREAVRLDPKFLSGYNTLAVIYLRHGDAARAEAVLHAALELAPDNPRMLANDAQSLRRLGRVAEADAVDAKLKSLEPFPPFYFYNQGEAALRAGDFKTARSMFKRELDREPDYHEFHYGLAVADFGLGRLDEARKELAIALENSVRRTDHDLYAAKLDKLKAYRQ
jgi:Flp pilus assembly protein TadD